MITKPSLLFGNDSIANKWGRSHDAQIIKEIDQNVFINTSIVKTSLPMSYRVNSSLDSLCYILGYIYIYYLNKLSINDYVLYSFHKTNGATITVNIGT